MSAVESLSSRLAALSLCDEVAEQTAAVGVMITQAPAEKLSRSLSKVAIILRELADAVDDAARAALEIENTPLPSASTVMPELKPQKKPPVVDNRAEIVESLSYFIEDPDLKGKITTLKYSLHDVPLELLAEMKNGLFKLLKNPNTFTPDQKETVRKFFICFETNGDGYTIKSDEESYQVNSYLARLCMDIFLGKRGFKEEKIFDFSEYTGCSSLPVLADFIMHETLPVVTKENATSLWPFVHQIQNPVLIASCKKQIMEKFKDICTTTRELCEFYGLLELYEQNDLRCLCLDALAKLTSEELSKNGTAKVRYDPVVKKQIDTFRELHTEVFVDSDGLLTLKIKRAVPAHLDLLNLDQVQSLDFSECHTVQHAIDWIVMRMKATNCTISKLNLSRRGFVCVSVLNESDFSKLSELLTYASSLKELDFSKMYLSAQLFSQFSVISSLRILKLNHCVFPIEGFMALASQPGFQLLEHLDIRQCCGLKMDDPIVSKAIDEHKKLKSLYFSRQWGASTFLINNSSIETIGLEITAGGSSGYNDYVLNFIGKSLHIKECIIFEICSVNNILQILKNPEIKVTLHFLPNDPELELLQYGERVKIQGLC